MASKTAMVEVDEKALDEMGTLEMRLEKARGLITEESSFMKKAILTAQAATIARKVVSAHKDTLAQLQGSALGFLADKPYSADELVNPLTEAVIMGLPLVGNCVNVISGRLYVPKAGWEYRFRTTTDISWPELHIGEMDITDEARYVDLPEEKWYTHNGKVVKQRSVPGMAKVECWAKCLRGGIELRVEYRDHSKTGGLDERIAIKVNRGMGEDAVRGKVEARLYKALWRLAMGADAATDNDADDDPNTINATAKPTSDSDGQMGDRP